MADDAYAGAAERWAAGATLVYAPAAAALVDRCPGDLAGHLVLDAGAGTGVAAAPLLRRGARPVAVDRSADMLGWRARERPPAAVADVRALPFPVATFDDALAAFVLNHLTDPEAGLAELARVTRPGGAVLAAVYSSAFTSPLRDRIDEVAGRAGWEPPGWYCRVKLEAAPLLGTADRMAQVARAAGLAEVLAEEEPLDVGIDRAEQLVDVRLGQAPFTPWLERLGTRRAAEVRAEAIAAVAPDMRPYRPVVVVLVARAAGPRSQPMVF